MTDEQQRSTAEIYRRLLRYTWNYWPGFVTAIVGMVLVAASEPGFALLMKPMLDGSFVDKDPEVIRLVPLGLLAIFIVRGVGNFCQQYFMEWVGRHVIRDLRSQMFDQFLRLPAPFYDRHSTGQLTSKLIFDVEQLASAATTVLTVLIKDSLTIIGLIGVMLYVSWQLTLFFIVVTPLIAIIIILISKRFRRISSRIQASVGDVSQISHQTIEGNQVVKVYRGEEYERGQFATAIATNLSQNMKMAKTSAVSVPISQFFVALAMAGVLYFATDESLRDTISVGTFMSFMTAAMMLLAPMKRLTQVTSALQRGIAAAQSIFTLLDERTELNQGQRILSDVQGSVEYRNVSFQYKDDGAKILDNINLTIAPGQTVAIVGRSGGGKSTLVNLLPRFYDATSGKILLDGVPLQELELGNLRDHIALVSQHVTLFNDSIAKNIAYGGKEDATEEEIREAAKAANALEFIDELPEGLETPIGEKGLLLSGGQRQRLAIARALLKNAPILILDEATSALDTESERHIQQALDLLMQGRTTLVIAHRLSTIEKADVIVVMDHGTIVEKGPHSELLAKGGHYAALHAMQFNEPMENGSDSDTTSE